MIMGPLYMLLGWVTLVIFLLLLGAATDGLKPNELLSKGVRWGELFAPLWLRDLAGLAFAYHLLRYRSMGVRAKATAIESILNVSLSVAFKLALLRRLNSPSGSIRLVCLPIYLSMIVSIVARAMKSAATPPDQRASSSVGFGIGVTHLLAITVACKLDGVSSYASSSWMATLWPLWLGLGALGVGVVMLACCFAPFLVCFSAAERRGPTERVLGPIMVVVTVFALVGWTCALVGCLQIALWLDGARATLPRHRAAAGGRELTRAGAGRGPDADRDCPEAGAGRGPDADRNCPEQGRGEDRTRLLCGERTARGCYLACRGVVTVQAAASGAWDSHVPSGGGATQRDGRDGRDGKSEAEGGGRGVVSRDRLSPESQPASTRVAT
jgi:hypothetical protein